MSNELATKDPIELLSLERDNKIDVADLQQEFRVFPSMLFSYCEVKSTAQDAFDRMKAQLEEIKATVYVELKSGAVKVTEAHVEALTILDPRVKAQQQRVFDAGRDLETTKNYVESLRAKKDMLIQLGADARKE